MTLTERILTQLKDERRCRAEVIRLLIDVERTKHFAAEGYSSLLGYCLDALGMSRSSSLKRIGAARLSARFPVVLERLERGEIHLGALTLLSRHLNEQNHLELLNEARGLSEDKLKRCIASRFPSEAKPPTLVQWLNENEAKLSLIVSAEVLALIERVKQLRKHAHPDGNLSSLLEEALTT